MVIKCEIESINKLLIELDKNRYEYSIKTVELGMTVYSLCKKNNFSPGMAAAQLSVGVTYTNMSRYIEAIPFLFKAIDISQKEKLYDLIVSAYINLGNISFDLADYEKSLDYYNTAEKFARKVKIGKRYFEESTYEYYTSKTNNNIGEIYKILGSYDDALYYYGKALKLDESSDFSATKGLILANIGEIKYREGKYNEAIEFINKALSYMNMYNFIIAIPECYRILALIYEENFDYDKARDFYTKSISMANETFYIYNKIDALMDFGKFLDKIGHFHEGLKKLNEAFEISVKNNIFAKTLEICKIFISIHEKHGNTEESYTFYKLYFEYENKLENVRTEQRIDNIKIKDKIQQLEKEKKNILEKSESFRRQSEELRETINNISIISELGQKIASTLNLKLIPNMLYNSVQTFMDATAFSIALYDDAACTIKNLYCTENHKDLHLPDVSIDSNASIAAYCLRHRKLVVVNDMNEEYSKYVSDNNYLHNSTHNILLNSAIFCPLVIDNNLLGVMTVQSTEKNAFTDLHTEMIKALSSYAAVAINNAIKSKNLEFQIEQRKLAQEELEKVNNKLLYLSENDSLTGIANRRKFDAFINLKWDIAKRLNSQISLILFDIDCFKQFNDNYGHLEGDRCLVKIARSLSSLLVGEDFAARYGGDEFVIVLPQKNITEALKLGEELRRNVESLNITHHFSIVKDVVTITLGAASVFPSENIAINEFIREADNALYEAKSKGRNQIIGYQ